MTQQHNGFFQDKLATVSVRESLFKYMAKWPFVLICVVLSVSAGILYIQLTSPKYTATTSFLVRGTEEGKSSSQDLIESALNGKKEVNLNNEMLLISSSGLMERAVAKKGFNISYFKKEKLKNIDIYENAPFTLTTKKITDSNQTYTIFIKTLSQYGGTFLFGPETKEKLCSFHWNEPFTISRQEFILTSKEGTKTGRVDYIARWEPVEDAASKLSEALIVKAYDTKTSVIQLTIKTENLQRGEDVLNALFDEFNMSDIEDRKKLSESTIQFIDDRLLSISGELKSVEGNLENYRGSNQLINLSDQSTQSLENSNTVSKTIKDISIQQGIASMILEYFNNPANGSKLVPSSFGLNDVTLASLITQYNELQLKKERETPLVTQNSTVMQDLNTQLYNLKSSIMESLSNINRNLQMQEKNLQQQNNQNRNYLSSIPHDERVLQEMKRKQNITEGLYLYLLQKREEAAISITGSNVAHYKQIDTAYPYGPVEPKSTNIIIYASLFGFFLAFGSIYLRSLLNDKITSREDITKRTSIPVFGQISHISKKKKELLSILGRNVIGEQFRAIRTNLYLLLKDRSKKIILVTSSTNDEGKSFVSLNLAAACAMPGNKVALLEFDIRKPTLASKLNLDNTRGLTLFLTGEVKCVSEISYALNKIPSLHIYPSGPLPLNPTDLLMAENMSHLFESLRTKYDYIIIDSPPIGVLSDPLILGEYSDMVLYIIRWQKTLKRQVDFITEMANNKSLNNVALVLNDLKKNDKYGYNDRNDYSKLNGSTKKMEMLSPA